jgi:ABC-type glycerol-3-phosphate transport system substrate-binding protein
MVENRKESGFWAAFSLVTQTPEIGGVIAGSYEIAFGIKKALITMGRSDISVIAIKESNWMEDEGVFAGQISASYLDLAKMAVEKLLDAIERPAVHERLSTVFKARFERTEFLIEELRKTPKTVRFATLDCPAAHSLRMLSEIYSKHTNLTVEFSFMGYNKLEDLLYNGKPQDLLKYDGYMVDIAWLDEIVHRGSIGSWGNFHETHSDYFDGFLDGVTHDHGIIDGELYAIPFMTGAQFLYYQKDLLNSQSLKYQFERIYGEPLEVPDSWAKLNIVAEFFTRKFNPKSPVHYGLTTVSGSNVFFAVSFLNCLLAYRCDTMDADGRVTINQPNAVKAMESFIRNYQYTSGKAHYNWNDAMSEFMAGDSAMIITFDSHTTEINNATKSKVAGNVGVAPVPGGCSVQGGWSLALSGAMSKEAREFILWACGEQTAVLSALLGGTTLRKSFYEKHDLETIYPWKSKIPDYYKYRYKRFGNSSSTHPGCWNYTISQIISDEAMRAVNGETGAEQALRNMEMDLLRLTGAL